QARRCGLLRIVHVNISVLLPSPAGSSTRAKAHWYTGRTFPAILAGNLVCVGLVLTHRHEQFVARTTECAGASGELVAVPIANSDRVIMRAVAITAIQTWM